MDLGRLGWDGVDWICLNEDRNQWQSLVNMAMNILVPRFHERWGVSWLAE